MKSETPCPLCGEAARNHPLYSTRDTKTSSKKTWNAVRCGNCSLVFLSPPASAEELKTLFESDSGYYKSDERQVAACLKRINKFPKGNLLDIGCGTGSFIAAAAKAGWEVKGVEVSGAAGNPYSMPIAYGDFIFLELPKKHYDVITLWGVTEYIGKPAEYFNKIRELLKDTGVVVLTAGNFDSIQRALMKVSNFPRQQVVWNRKSMDYLFSKTGFKLADIDYRNDVRSGRPTEFLTFCFKRYFLGRDLQTIHREHNNSGQEIPFWMLPVKILDRLVTLPLSALLSLVKYNGIMNITAAKKP